MGLAIPKFRLQRLLTVPIARVFKVIPVDRHIERDPIHSSSGAAD